MFPIFNSGFFKTISIMILNTASILKTGKITSYVSGDDGETQRGRLSDFNTLEFNNPFGNINRFTDELGGQDYVNRICLDWAQWNNVTGTVQGYSMDSISGNMTLPSPTCISGCEALSLGGFTGFKMANVNEILAVFNWEDLSTALLGLPFQSTVTSGASQIYTSTYVSSTNVIMVNTSKTFVSFSGSVDRSSYAVRIFTLTELGL